MNPALVNVLIAELLALFIWGQFWWLIRLIARASPAMWRDEARRAVTWKVRAESMAQLTIAMLEAQAALDDGARHIGGRGRYRKPVASSVRPRA